MSDTPTGPPPVLRVVTLNIGSLIEPDWEQRRVEIVAWLDELEPDIVCCQEVWESDTSPNTAAWLADEAAGTWHHVFGGHPFHRDLWKDSSLLFGSAVLSRWPIDQSNYQRLPVVGPADGDAGDGDDFVTKVPWEILHCRTADLDVFVTHLAAAPTQGDHRQAQVKAIDQYVRSVRGDRDAGVGFGQKRPHMPAILCGDFNAEPESDEIRFLSSLATLDGVTTFWQDAWRVAGEGPGYTQDWRTNPVAASLNVHRKRIDYVFVGDPFVRAGDAGRILSAQVVFDEARTGILASDHFGVMAEVVWPQRPD